MLDVKIKGFAELQKALDELPAKLEKNIMRGALRAGAKVFQAGAQRRVPVRSGKLRDSIRVSTRVVNGKIMATITAGGSKKGAPFYAHLIEFGAKAHVITASKAKALHFGGGLHEKVHHPGARKAPFMRPTLDADAPAAVLAVGKIGRAHV